MKRFIVWLMIFLFVCSVTTGCVNWKNLFSPNSNSSISKDDPNPKNVFKNNGNLFTLFMVGTVAGAIAGMSGIKFGWVVTAGNIGGIALSLAIAEYSKWIALGGIIAAISVIIIMLIRNKQFQLNTVSGVQALKKALPSQYKDLINKVMQEHQNPETEKVVQSVKRSLEKKEEKEKSLEATNEKLESISK